MLKTTVIIEPATAVAGNDLVILPVRLEVELFVLLFTTAPDMVIVLDFCTEPEVSERLKITVYVPDELYEYDGFCSVDVAGVPPENVHSHAVAVPL